MISRASISHCEVFWHVPTAGIPKPPRKLGTLARNDKHLYFAYDEAWLGLNQEISPGFLPLQLGTIPISLTDERSTAFIPDLDLRNEFRGLPGPFYDSLPDRWGMKLIEKHTGLDANQLDPLALLCHRGDRCMGAFSYHPASTQGAPPGPMTPDDLDLYCRHAAMISSGTGAADLQTSIMDALEDSGGSAGGMRPKMLLAIRKDAADTPANTPVLRKLAGYDHTDMPVEFEPWLLKFDTEPEQCRGRIEEACAQMARFAGVEMPVTRVIRTQSRNGTERFHFAILRFDRQFTQGKWHRVHMHTAAGMLQRDYNKLDLDYTDLLELTAQLTHDPAQVRQVFTRAVFNVFAGNSDDHAKNHAFLMDASGKWSISPAYDLTPSSLRMQPGIRSTSILGNKSEKIPLSLLRDLGHEHAINDPDSVILQVSAAVRKWRDFAKAAGVPTKITDRYGKRIESIHPAELKGSHDGR